MVKYKLNFNCLDVKQNTNSIFQFLCGVQDFNDEFTGTILDDLNISGEELKNLDDDARYDFIYNKVSVILEQESKGYNSSVDKFQKEWDKNCDNIYKIFAGIFENNYTDELECRVNVSVNPICPRYIKTKSFDVNYKLKSVLGICIHELLHFYWFDYWDKHLYKLKDSEKETPSLTWAFSEIAIDALVNCTDLKQYFNREDVAYDYFYDIKYHNQKLIDVLRDMFKKLNLKEFMVQGYNILQDKEVCQEL